MSEQHGLCRGCGAGSAQAGSLPTTACGGSRVGCSCDRSGGGCSCGAGGPCAGYAACTAARTPPCALPVPRIVERTLARIRADLSNHRRGYTPEWSAPDSPADAGTALVAILARNLDIQNAGLNAMPLRLQLEFLDRLGAQLLAAQSARAPLVFKLLDTATGDATVPAGTRVAAVLPPPAPSLDGDVAPAARAASPEFFTEQEITAMRGRLKAVYTIDPQDDVYVEHTTGLSTGFALFSGMAPVPHRLYLGHDALFRLSGAAQIVLTFDFATPGMQVAGAASRARPLLLDWEYLSDDGWLPLLLVEDGTARFTRDGKIVLAKTCGPDAKLDTVAGKSSYWIRASVSSRVPAARVVDDPLPGSLEVRVESTIEILPRDVVTVDGTSRAVVLGTTAKSLRLDRLPELVRAGEYLTLADALPPLRPDGADEEGALPRVDVIRARVGFSKSDLVPDAAFLDGFALDIGKDFHPFGPQPERFAAFYLACRDAFSRSGARVELTFAFAQTGTALAAPKVVAEYFDGSRWIALGPDDEYADDTHSFTKPPAPPSGYPTATVAFVVPVGWVESAINGETSTWLRFRLASGDYGTPPGLSVVPDPANPGKFIVQPVAATLVPPIVAEVRVSYVVFSNPSPLDHCVTENDFVLADHGADARWSRGAFAPFVPVADRAPALHFGFSAKPPPALASMLAAIAEPAADAAPQPLVWDYWGERGWTELSVRDVTAGFRQTGLVQFVGAPDAEPRDGLGGRLYRVRARLKPGLSSRDYRIGFAGLWLNAVWATEGTRFAHDTLGVSNGEPDQTFALPLVRAGAAVAAGGSIARDPEEFERALDLPVPGVPVLAGESVEVREWIGRGDDWQTVVAGVPATDLRFESDPRDPSIRTAAWVRWHAQPHLYASGPQDRHYTIERARGVFRFPDRDGFAPPAGCPIVASYVTGGGTAGNVPAGSVRELRSGVGFVESVANPLPAAGGAAPERLRNARDRSAQAVRHRQRAVSYEDYEWLARQASAEVARVRALPLAGPAGCGQRGFVGLVLVPHSTDAAPLPSPELQARVLAYLARRVPAGIAGGVRIVAPEYVRVGIRAEILPRDPDEAGRIEARVRNRLAAFLHPLGGGRTGYGWEFGAAVHLSDVAALLEAIPGVDAVRFVQLGVGAAIHPESVPVEPHQLVAAGVIQVKLLVPSPSYALA